MNSLKTFTHDDLIALRPCSDGREWAYTQPTMSDVWTNCPRGDWLWWLLRKIQLPTKEQSVLFANNCAQSAKQHANAAANAAYAAADYAAADANAAAAANAANAASAYAHAAHAANAADAAADTAAYAAERLNQANFIRSIIPNPFI